MSKQMKIAVTVMLTVECQDNSIQAEDIVNDMDYDFESSSAGAEIVDTEIREYETVSDMANY